MQFFLNLSTICWLAKNQPYSGTMICTRIALEEGSIDQLKDSVYLYVVSVPTKIYSVLFLV